MTYGVVLTLPKQASFAKKHLLGDNFEYTRWFKDEKSRADFVAQYQNQHRYYRKGDIPTLNYRYIES